MKMGYWYNGAMMCTTRYTITIMEANGEYGDYRWVWYIKDSRTRSIIYSGIEDNKRFAKEKAMEVLQSL